MMNIRNFGRNISRVIDYVKFARRLVHQKFTIEVIARGSGGVVTPTIPRTGLQSAEDQTDAMRKSIETPHGLERMGG